ncbi:proline-rich protein 22 [Struthio camelus]|uniref:proline-rich protein 22 n=1 Tax=Struthio camelus TaxID=8801 RepID=UPI00360423F1
MDNHEPDSSTSVVQLSHVGARRSGEPRRPAPSCPEPPPPAGSSNLYQPPGQEKEAFAAPPAGLQMAPCGCFFDPRIYRIEWAATGFLQPPVLLDAQRYLRAAGQPDPFAPYQPLPRYAVAYPPPEEGVTPPGAAVGPAARRAAPLLLPPPPLGLAEPPLCGGYGHIQGRLKPVADAAPGPPAQLAAGRPVPGETPSPAPTPNAAPGPAAVGSPAPAARQPADLPEKVLLEDAMKLFDCSLAAELGQDELSSVLKLGERPGADGFFLCEEAAAARDIGSLWLPEELLSSDYNVPEILGAVLSMDYFYAIKVTPEEMGWDAGLEPPDGAQETRRETEENGSSPKTGGRAGSTCTASPSRPGERD